VTISLTIQGRRVFREIENRFNAYFGNVLARIPAPRRKAVVEAMALLAETVRSYNEASGCCRGRN
jgi:hypothetical protein